MHQRGSVAGQKHVRACAHGETDGGQTKSLPCRCALPSFGSDERGLANADDVTLRGTTAYDSPRNTGGIGIRVGDDVAPAPQ